MTETESTPATGTVFERWLAVMGDCQAIGKNEKTTGGSKFSFRGVDTVVNAVGPILRKHGVFVAPSKASVEYRSFSSKSGTQMLEAFVTAGYTVYGAGGDSFTMEVVAQASDASDKATTQAMSVAQRTALLQGLTVPTDDPEPDQHYVEREVVDEEAEATAREGGWQDTAQRNAVWEAVLTTAQALPQEAHDAVVLPWAKKVKLNPATFTVAISEEWKAKIAEAASPVANPEDVDNGDGSPVPAAEQGIVGDEEPGHDQTTDPGFDGAAAWHDLDAKMSRLGGKDCDAINAWLKESGVLVPADTTKAIAAEWYAKMADVLGSEIDADPAAPRPWKSKAEAKRTFDSLTERQAKLPEMIVGDVKLWYEENGITKDLTREESEAWLARIIEGEFAASEPF